MNHPGGVIFNPGGGANVLPESVAEKKKQERTMKLWAALLVALVGLAQAREQVFRNGQLLRGSK